MGEIIDLEGYRRRVKRKALETRSVGNRRQPDKTPPPAERPRGAAEPHESGRLAPGGGAAPERSDTKAD